MNIQCQNHRITGSVYLNKKSDILSIFLQAGISMDDAEDMTQDVFVRMMKVDTLNETTAVAMAVKIAFNMRIDYFRKRKLKTVDIDSACNVADFNNNAAMMTICGDINRLEQEAIDKLSPRLARIYTMNQMEDMPIKEIALELGVSKRTVENQVYFARRVVRQYLSNVL